VPATGINAEETLDVDGVEITAIASAHETLETNARGEHRFLGYIVKLAGTAIYHSGDCVPYEGLPERLRREKVDVALLPVNGRGKGVQGNFTLDEAVALCRAAGIETLIVHHFGMFAFNTVARAEIERQAAGTAPPPSIIIPQPGDRYRPCRVRKGEQEP
jgi:L-ascorbate metabolism protein UlaG (beta-lactamase superfamily)